MSDTIIVDDQDASISYTGLWTLAGEGSDYSQTAYSSNATGATMTFNFSGTSLTAIGNYASGGRCNATFSIDGDASNFTSPLLNTTQHQQTLWTSPTLTDGSHTFVYTVESCENFGSYIWFDYLLYNSTTASNGVTYFFDDRDPQLEYSGTWNATGSEGDFRFTRQGGASGSSFQFAFTGTSVQVYGRIDNGTGGLTQASFSVDGAPAVTFAAAPPSLLTLNKQLFSSRALSPGQHTLVATSTSDVPLWIDYLLVRSAGVLPNATMPASSSGKSSPVGPIAGSVAGCIVFIAAIAAAIFFFRRRRNSRIPPSRLSLRKSNHNIDSDPFRAPKVITTTHAYADSMSAANSGIELSAPFRRQPYTESSTSYTMTDSPGHSTIGLPYEVPVTHATSDSYLEYPHMNIPHGHTNTSSVPTPPRSFTTHQSSPSDSSASPSAAPSHSYSTTPLIQDDTRNLTFDTPRSSSAGRSRTTVPTRGSTLSNPDDIDHLSAAELKRRHQLVVLSPDDKRPPSQSSHRPVVHTDSGIRLSAPLDDSFEDPDLNEAPPMYTRE